MPNSSFLLNDEQRELVMLEDAGSIFLEGPAGAGKTTAVVARLLRLLSSGVPGDSILVILPQRTLGTPYLKALSMAEVVSGGAVSILTASGLAQRMVELFWPLVAEDAGFKNPYTPPVFLTLETAQYHIARLVTPLLDQGYFDSVVIDRNRLFSQILDNLNKSAVVGFPYTEIGERLKSAWIGTPGQLRVYDDAQFCASLFRQTCLENNLLDFSLQVEVFWKHVWRLNLCRKYLSRTYRHIIADNLEEDTPFTHNLLAEWIPGLDSMLMVFDNQAGFRRFLGADPGSAYLLKDLCTMHRNFSTSLVTSTSIAALNAHIEYRSYHLPPPMPVEDPRPALQFHTSRYYPQMLDWVAEQTSSLIIDQGVPPSEIVILAPYLSDALRYGLIHRLEALSVPVSSHRPSRSLREEPATHALMTLAKIAHPDWNLPVTKYDLANTLLQTIGGCDLVRSHLLAEVNYRSRDKLIQLQPFERINPTTQERITYVVGERYERLRLWLESYRKSPSLELDHFLATLFGEVLSQPGFQFHTGFDAGTVTARLIESVCKFRRVAASSLLERGIQTGQEYIRMVEQGVIAAQYLQSWQLQETDAVLVAPAYTFLMRNSPVTVQFWLDIGSRSWSDRLSQPLTHPYVLSRTWPRDRVWTDADEVETSQQELFYLITGLLRRCRRQVFLGLSDLGEQGFEQRGPLLRVINRVLQAYAAR